MNSQNCVDITTLCFQSVPSPQKKPPPYEVTPPLPQPPTARNPLSVSVDQPVLGVSPQWGHTLCVLVSGFPH